MGQNMFTLTAIEELKREKENYDYTQKMEVIINPSKGFSLVEALLRCLGFGKEKSVSLFCSNRDLDDEFLLKNLPAVEKDADSSPTPESDPPAADPPATRTSPRVRVAALALPTVPTPGGSTGSGGQHN